MIYIDYSHLASFNPQSFDESFAIGINGQPNTIDIPRTYNTEE